MSRMTMIGMSFIFYNFLNGFSSAEYTENYLLYFFTFSSYGFMSILENKVGN